MAYEDPVRSLRQSEIVKAWGKAKGHGTLEAATGFGKTRVALKAIQALRQFYPTGEIGPDTLVIVPSIALRDKWGEDIRDAGLTGIRVAVINGIVLSDAIREFRFLILDEVHTYTSEVFGQIFQRIKYKYVLGLTATMPPDDQRRRMIEKYAPVIATVSLAECLKNNWVSTFSVFNLGVELNEEEAAVYEEIDTSFAQFFSKFGHDMSLMFLCLKSPQESRNHAINMGWDSRKPDGDQLWTPERVRIWAINANRKMNERMNFLLNLPRKVDIATQIVDRFPQSRIITFSHTTVACDMLTEKIGPTARSYHSSVKGKTINGVKYGKDKLLNLYLRQFADGNAGVNVLNTAKALDQGIDIAHIDLLITLAASSKVRQALQRLGRAIRFRQGKHAMQVEIYAKGTQEETWLKKRQKEIPKERITEITSIDEIPF